MGIFRCHQNASYLEKIYVMMAKNVLSVLKTDYKRRGKLLH